MKKVLGLVLVLAMTFSLVGCSNTPADPTKAPVDTQAPAGNETNAPAPSTDKISVAMVTDLGGVHDKSFNEGAWAGLQKAQADFGIEVSYLESKTEADYAPNLDTLYDEGHDLIVGIGFLMAEAVRDAALAHPDQAYAIVDDATNADLPNVTCLMFKNAQASYLAGAVAAKMSKTNNVGFIIGMVSPVMNEFGYGYVAGVLDTNPDAKVQQYNANAFGDAAAGKSAAITMFTNGADIVYHAAGGTGIGVIEAAKDQGKYAIGVDIDQAYVAPEAVLTSAMKRVDNAVYDISKQVQDGNVTKGVITYDLSSGGVGLAPTQDLLTEEVIAYVEDLEAKIISGEIVVLDTQKEFEEKYGKDAYTLDEDLVEE